MYMDIHMYAEHLCVHLWHRNVLRGGGALRDCLSQDEGGVRSAASADIVTYKAYIGLCSHGNHQCVHTQQIVVCVALV